jgi:TonB family protein
MAMPGSFLPLRIQKIIEGGPVPRVSRTRMACVAVICTLTCTVFAAGKLVRTQQAIPEQSTKTEHPPEGVQILTPHEGVDFASYTNHLVESIKRSWYAQMPQEASAGLKGKVVVRFKIQKNGKLARTPMVESNSGNKQLDNAAVSAIRASSPFEHLPEAFKGSNIELRFIFLYNLPLSVLNP